MRQRVTNVGTYTTLNIEAFMAYVRQYMCGNEVLELTPDDMQQIAEIEKELQSVESTLQSVDIKENLRLLRAYSLQILKNEIAEPIIVRIQEQRSQSRT